MGPEKNGGMVVHLHTSSLREKKNAHWNVLGHEKTKKQNVIERFPKREHIDKGLLFPRYGKIKAPH